MNKSKLLYLLVLGSELLALSLREEKVFGSFAFPVAEVELGDGFGAMDSIFIFTSDSLLSKDFYTVSPGGKISFSSPIPAGRPIRVVYYHRLRTLKSEYIRYSPKPVEPESLADSTAKRPSTNQARGKTESGDRGEWSATEEILFSGSKSAGFNYSRDGLTFEQATDLKVSGSVRGFDLSLTLSDKSLPQLEEKTLEVRELEGIALSLTRNTDKVVFGDFSNLSPFGEFGQVKRKGYGIALSHTKENGGITLSYQKPRNKSGLVQFFGADGKKGPYLLTAEGRRVAIIPGTEEVYLDGERKKRGENEDYTIDYSAGEITFTNRVFISSLSRIEVGFLYQVEDYERNSYSFHLAEEKPGIGGFLSAFYEADDKGYNFLHPLTEEEERYLATIGDDTLRAFLPGERYVGENRGDYKKISGEFVYCGEGSGDYEVSFSLVGEGRGEYIYDNEINGFRFVGAGAGNWTPKKFVRLPQSRLILSPGITISPFLPFSVSLTGIGIAFDRNTFSSQDDNDNLGYGYKTKLDWREKNSAIGFERKAYLRNYQFAEEEERDFVYIWGEKKDSVKSLNQLSGNLWLAPFLRLDLGGAILEKERENIYRYFSRANLSFLGLGLERVKRTSRANFTLKPTIRSFQPSFSFRIEQNERERITTYEPDLRLTIRAQEISAGWERRAITAINSGLIKEMQRIKWQVNRKGHFFDFSLLFGDEKMKGYEKGEETKQNFANLGIGVKGISFLTGNLEGELKHKGIEEKEVQYIKVAEGKGNYKKDPNTGNYFYQENGDYIRVFVPTGKIQGGVANTLRGYLSLNPKEFTITSHLNWQKTTQDTTSGGEVRDWSIYLTLNFLPDLRFRANRTYNLSLDRNFSFEARQKISDQYSFALEKDLPRDWRVEPGLELKRNLGFNTVLTRRQLERKIKLETFLGLPLRTEVGLSYGEITGEDYSSPTPFRIEKKEFSSRRSFFFWERVGLNLSFEISHRRSQDTLPYELTFPEPLGLTYSSGCEVNSNPTEKINLSFQYRLKKEPNTAIEHILTASTRIEF